MFPSGIIFSFWRLTCQTTLSADPPVSADPRILGTDILKWVSSCLNIVPCIFKQHPYFKNFETGLVRFQNTCEKHLSILIGKNRPAFSAIYLFIYYYCGQMSFIVRLLSRFMAWEIRRTLHNFLQCLTFMLFRICNKINYLFTQITVISVVLRTILRQQTLPFIQNICQTEQNTAHYMVFLTKCIQLSLKFHIF